MAPNSERGHRLQAALGRVQPVSDLDPERFVGLYLPGGHGCLFDVNRNTALHTKIRALYERGALLAAVCHATSTFALVEKDGRSIVHGHRLTGFPNPLDRALLRLHGVHERFRPLPLVNDAELRKAGARLGLLDVMRATLDPTLVRESGPFITGVGPKAARRVAKKLTARLPIPREVAVPKDVWAAT
jgi:putative intracellular protease/amidase